MRWSVWAQSVEDNPDNLSAAGPDGECKPFLSLYFVFTTGLQISLFFSLPSMYYFPFVAILTLTNVSLDIIAVIRRIINLKNARWRNLCCSTCLCLCARACVCVHAYVCVSRESVKEFSFAYFLETSYLCFGEHIHNLHWSFIVKPWLQPQRTHCIALSRTHCGIQMCWHHSAGSFSAPEPLSLVLFVALLWLLYQEPISGLTYRQQDGNKLLVMTKALCDLFLLAPRPTTGLCQTVSSSIYVL